MSLYSLLIVVAICFVFTYGLYNLIDYIDRKYNEGVCKVCANNAIGLLAIIICLFNQDYLPLSIVIWLSLQAGNALLTELEFGDSFIHKVKSFKTMITKLLSRVYEWIQDKLERLY